MDELNDGMIAVFRVEEDGGGNSLKRLASLIGD